MKHRRYPALEHPAVLHPGPPGPFASAEDEEFLALAVDLASGSVAEGGGPFGAVVVHRGLVLGMGTNEVTRSLDPTGHAEIVAVRAACRRLARADLDGCVLYASCEPCPLCLATCRWARLPRVVHASSRASALAAGYADELQYESLEPAGHFPLVVQQAWLSSAAEPFAAWRDARRSA